MAWTKTYSGVEPLRINKWLALEGICSRREADALISQGLVKVDGEAAIAGQKIEPGQTLNLAQKASRRLDNQISLVFHKPIGIVSGTPEEGEIPAVRLITAETLSGKSPAIPGRYNKLAPLGRLDKDSRGLLIMSEDGVLAKAIIGPESQLDKEYIVKVKGEVSEDKLSKLRHGLELDGRQLKPAIVERIKDFELKFVLREGRNRQIRRMCQLVDLRVVDLMRTRIGPLELAGLPEGKWRPISNRERQALLGADRAGSASPEAARPESPKEPSKATPRGQEDRRASPMQPAKTARKPGVSPERSGQSRAKDGSDKKPAPLKGEKFRRTKLAPRKRIPIK